MADPKARLSGVKIDPAWLETVKRRALEEGLARAPQISPPPRLLVPIDVQALYVPEGSEESFARLPFALAGRDGEPPPAMPKPFAEGERREPGVHLRWALPDALLRGRLENPDGGNRLALPALPDRWAVLRILAPKGAARPAIDGWVLDAAGARAVPLEAWPAGAEGAPQEGRTVPPGELNGSAGGSPAWTAVYDATRNRFAFHDPLDGLQELEQKSGAVANAALYVVAGWHSDEAADPLAAGDPPAPLAERLGELGWRLAGHGKGARSLGGPHLTLLQGEIHGVPVRGEAATDQRPDPTAIELALGSHENDLIATLAGLKTAEDPAARRKLERLLSAFTGQLLSRLDSPDGLVEIEEQEHGMAFASRPGGQGPLERLRAAGEAAPLPAGQTARSLAAKPSDADGAPKPRSRARREERVAGQQSLTGDVAFSPLVHSRAELFPLLAEPPAVATEMLAAAEGRNPRPEYSDEPREQRRPAPRFHHPIEPQVAVRGPKRSLIAHGDGRFWEDGKLVCRWPSQTAERVGDAVDGSELIPELAGEGLPEEVLAVARDALVKDSFLIEWLAAAAASRVEKAKSSAVQGAVRKLLLAETAMRVSAAGVFDGGIGRGALGAAGEERLAALVAHEQVQPFSRVDGAEVDPVGLTIWSQPWIPLFLEWEVEAAVEDRFEDWPLGPIDLEPVERRGAGKRRKIAGRSLLGSGPAKTLKASLDAWAEAEQERDRAGDGEADEETERLLASLGETSRDLDVVAAGLDTLHDELLGLPVEDYGVLKPRAGAKLGKPAPVAAPQLTIAGELKLTRARLVDAFGRTLELPVDETRTPARSAIEGRPGALRVRPRLLRPARWMLRFADPADPSAASREATLDQVEPARTVNPVAGFLLPDHIDEALEAFDTAGRPLGQLMHEPFGGGVMWEIAPGRAGPPDAPPGHDLAEATRIVGEVAAGLLAADARARDGKPAGEEEDSALTALLRAIDTTLWSIDSFASFGNEHIAGLVGRPVAVTRALLRLELDDDLDELDLSGAKRRALRERAYAELAEKSFPVRLGELTRADDGLLGFFVDDDYGRMRVVDKAVRDGALESGRFRGHFGAYGETPRVPPTRPIDHPYLEAEDELRLKPGETLRLTLLMHPMGKCHLTSGVLPRKSVQLARDWVNPGLAAISPSVRVGPVLIEPGEVRLPKVSSLPEDQLWTRRDSPATWKDDPIVAATQAALLPKQPAAIEEGYIRVAPQNGAQP